MTMKRPSDQAKLFLLGLLRTVSALATEPRVFSTTAAYGAAAVAGGLSPHITLRLARRTDVPSMQRCNLASLPENYNQQFFQNHMRQWPELTIVAECAVPSENSFSPFHHHNNNHNNSGPDSHIVAYVLGKVEDRTVPTQPHHHHHHHWQPQQPHQDDPYRYRSRSYHHHDDYPPPFTTERVGHVTSLAVLEDHRRQGLARELMNQLHYHLETCYGVDAVGLHVRQSNTAATGLYERFGYAAAERISGYYQDGEDAFFMKKRLGLVPKHHQQNGGAANRLFGGFRKSKPWESGPENVRLPRLVGKPVVNRPRHQEPSSSSQSSPSSSAPELLTGSM